MSSENLPFEGVVLRRCVDEKGRSAESCLEEFERFHLARTPAFANIPSDPLVHFSVSLNCLKAAFFRFCAFFEDPASIMVRYGRDLLRTAVGEQSSDHGKKKKPKQTT